MSTLFHIRIELAVPPTAWVLFEVTHPDQREIPKSKNIALLVVVEAYGHLKGGFGFPDLVAEHPQREKLECWLQLYRRFDGPAFAAEAAEAILEVELVNEDGNPRRQDEDPDPKATMVFTAKEPTILSHLVSGLSFDSAMYDCRLW